MRVDLARALLEDRDVIVFDEYTSVVDRDVAKVCSLAVNKAIRNQNKKFIAVSCHDDIIEWLQPDWVYDTNQQTFPFGPGNVLKSRLTSSTPTETQDFGRYLGSIII